MSAGRLDSTLQAQQTNCYVQVERSVEILMNYEAEAGIAVNREGNDSLRESRTIRLSCV